MAKAKVHGRWRGWTKERLIAALHDAEVFYGRRPAQVDFDPSHARRLGHEERARVAEENIRLGEWPSHHTFRDHFGSWNAAMIAAGYRPRKIGRQVEDDAHVGASG